MRGVLLIGLVGCGFNGHGTKPSGSIDAPPNKQDDAPVPIDGEKPIDAMIDARVIDAPPMIDAPPQTLHVIEAESYNGVGAVGGHSWTASAFGGGFSGTGYMASTPADGTPCDPITNVIGCAPVMTYVIDVPADGMYYLYGRGFATNGSTDSWWMGIDNAVIDKADVDENILAWQWRRLPNAIAITAGQHAIDVWMREAGIDLDQIAWGEISVAGP